MAAPNIVNITSVVAGLAYVAPPNTAVNVLLSNNSDSNTLIKVGSLTCTNVSASAATVTVAITSNAAGGGIAYRIAYQISIPSGSSLQLIDKGNFVYLTEDKSMIVTSGTASAIEFVTSYETIS